MAEHALTLPERLPIPAVVLDIARRLERAGFETWCVGGAIRDNLLGLENQDYDLATAARPEDVQRLFRRTIPIGVEHGTVAVLNGQNRPHEVTTFRKDIRTDGRHAEVEFGVSLQDDLARRDFTINAIAYHPVRHEWRDPFGGVADLDRRLIRAVGDPNWRFQEDYLRILRALRFSARFEFRIHVRTLEAGKANVQGLAQLSAERVRDEWFKGLATAKQPSQLLRLWDEVGALTMWLPEVVKREKRKVKAVDALDRFGAADPVLMTAYLSNDPAATLARLRCSNADIERARLIGAYRTEWPDVMTDLAVRRWLAIVGPAADDLLAIAQAEGWGNELADVAARVRMSHAPLAIGDLALSGKDLLELGVPQGPDVGILLDALLDLVIEQPELNTREDLIRLATRLTAEMPIPESPRRRSSRHHRPPETS